ncbi:hypothetical protein GW17_00055918 [Ensete ventricosum]|nr:hypothetical protein GW17_00055918 [Ensete ventricosum]
MGSRTSTLSQKNTMVINFARSRARVKFRSVFRAQSRKFKILAILEVLAHDDGPRSSLGIGPGSDNALGLLQEFARRFAEGIRKLIGNTPGERREKIGRLTARMPEATRLAGWVNRPGRRLNCPYLVFGKLTIVVHSLRSLVMRIRGLTSLLRRVSHVLCCILSRRKEAGMAWSLLCLVPGRAHTGPPSRSAVVPFRL